MASKKLVRRLKRELTANPKKGAALALLLIVAGWFWMPLVEKYFQKPEDSVPTEAKPGPANATADAASAAAGAGTTKSTSDHWKEVVDWIHSDPMMKPQAPPAGARNPFGPSEARRLASEQASRAAVPPPPADVTPQESGLVLRSTAIGPRNRTALINQRAYHEGQMINTPKETEHFKLVRIETKYVVLEHNGKQFQLKLPTVDVAGVDE